MMDPQWLLLPLGVLLLVATIVDGLQTTFSLSRAGPITARLARGMWRVAVWLTERTRWRPVARAGEVITLIQVSTWILGFWLGWGLIFAAPPAVVEAASGAPAPVAARIAYVGEALFTRTPTGLDPGGPSWELLSPLVAGTGLFFITLTITYLGSITAAASDLRSAGKQVWSLGDSPTSLVTAAWNGRDFGALVFVLSDLQGTVARLAERILTYRVLRYFSGGERAAAFAPNLAVLDEALLILEAGVAPQARPDRGVLRSSRRAVTTLIEIEAARLVRPVGAAPPPPDLTPLREAGIPCVDDATFAARAAERAPRRQAVATFCAESAWPWDQVTASEPQWL